MTTMTIEERLDSFGRLVMGSVNRLHDELREVRRILERVEAQGKTRLGHLEQDVQDLQQMARMPRANGAAHDDADDADGG